MTGAELQQFVREEMVWTQQQFARFLGVEPNSVTRWVKGRHPVPAWVDTVVRLLRDAKRLAGLAGVDVVRDAGVEYLLAGWEIERNEGGDEGSA